MKKERAELPAQTENLECCKVSNFSLNIKNFTGKEANYERHNLI